MPMYELELQAGTQARRHFIVLADDVDDARRRLASILQFLDAEETEASGIITREHEHYPHGTALEIPGPTVGYFETED